VKVFKFSLGVGLISGVSGCGFISWMRTDNTCVARLDRKLSFQNYPPSSLFNPLWPH